MLPYCEGGYVKAISWVEKVAEFPEEQRATHGRLAWAAKDKITEILWEGARLIKRAPLPGVSSGSPGRAGDPGHAIGWRVWAWAKLVKVWGSNGLTCRLLSPDAMVATAGLLGILGLPLELQGIASDRCCPRAFH